MRVFKRFNLALYLICLGLFLGSLFALFSERNITKRAGAADTVTIQPGAEGKDSYVFGGMGMQNTNYGDAAAISSGGGSGTPPPVRAYLQFDLSSIPSGVTIDSASLSVYYYTWFGPNDISLNLSAKRVTSSWDEHTITWNLQPSYNASAESTVAFGNSSSYGWYSFNIKSLVEGWTAGSYSNYGIAIDYPIPVLNNAKSLYSSDEAVNTTLRPKLIVTYTSSVPPPDPDPDPTHKACVNNACQTVSGTGSDSCSNDTQCQTTIIPTPTTTHKVCQSDKCISVSGSGNNECSDDTSCAAVPAGVIETPTDTPTTESSNTNDSNSTANVSRVSKLESMIKKLSESNIPVVPLAAAGALSVASAVISFWTFLSAELSAKEYLLALINYVIALFSAKDKNKQGKVYDATTKKPIKGALINLYSYPGMRLISSALTDILGRFYFVARKGNYVLSATCRGFIFPSQYAKHELLYSKDLYMGQTIELNDAEVLNNNIPMDPSAKTKSQSPNILKLIFLSNVTRLVIMFGGTVISVVILYYSPVRTNYIVLSAYMFLWLIELMIESRQIRFSKIVDASSGQPIDLALVRVAAKNGKLLQTYVSDFQGRVAIKTDSSDDIVMIERMGYKKLEKRPEKSGFIEGYRFKLQKVS